MCRSFISSLLRLALQGIGNTAQGAANCIMFVFCTRPIRTRLCATLCCCSKCRAGPLTSQDAPNRLPSGQDPSTKRGEEEDDGTSQVQIDRWHWTRRVWNVASLCHMREEFCVMNDWGDAFWMYCWVILTGNTADKGLHVGLLYYEGGWVVLFIEDCRCWRAAKLVPHFFPVSTSLVFVETLTSNKGCMGWWQRQACCKCL